MAVDQARAVVPSADRPGLKVFIPITTMLLLSALVSLVAWLLRR
jgi:hypothetical protein